MIQTARLIVLVGGTATDIAAAEGGAVVVSSGGTLNDCTVSSGGTATVLNSGYVQDVTVEASGMFLVSSGGTAHQSIISSGGTQIVYAETMAASATVLDGGFLQVESDGYVRAPVVSQGGTMSVQKGVAEKAKLYGAAEIVGVAQYTEVLNDGRLDIQSNGWSLMASVGSGGSLVYQDGGLGQMDTICDGGTATVFSGGTAILPAVDPGGMLVLYDGASAQMVKENGGYVEVADGAEVSFVSNAISELTLADASATVHSGTTANRANVKAGGKIEVFSGGTATEVLENGGYVEISDEAAVTFASNTISGLELAGSATVHSGTTVTNTTVNAGGRLEVFSGGTVNGVTINPGGMAEVSSGVISGAVVNADGSLLIYDGTRITGHMTFESGATVIPFVGSILDFDLTQTEAGAVALVNDLSILLGTPSYTLTVAYAQGEGTYALADGAAKFNSTITVRNTLGETFGMLTVGETLNVDGMDYTLNLTNSVLSITVELPVMPPTNLVGTKDRVSWDPVGTDGYAVEYSTDGFAHCLGVKVSSNALDMLELPAGTYQWRVKEADGEAWAVGDEIVSDNDNAPKVVQSNADGSDDLFFATAGGTWENNIYYAQHVGSINDWGGTNEILSANGKGRIQNLFFGSTDPNVLCLTDEDNGDAIFIDDVYTDLPDEVAEHTARLYRIREIRAGFGDDIVDMTSQRFEYIGDGQTIRGGDGNDTIWANKGDNLLFGDTGNDRIVGASGNDVIVGGIGNDRMHGGGGNDVFTFCDNWGIDTVEQLAGGSVTLWFTSEMEGKVAWDDLSESYTDGVNHVSVKGVSSVELKFGGVGEDAAMFASLSEAGAFQEFTSQRVFEESNGLLA